MKLRTTSTVAAIAGLGALLATGAHAQTIGDPFGLGAAGPQNFTLLSLGGDINGTLGTVDGNIGVPGTANIKMQGPTVINGNIDLATTATKNITGHFNGSTIQNAATDALLSSAVSDALNASSTLGGLSNTVGGAPSSVSGSTTITGGAGRNVVNLSDIKLSGSSILTLSAPSDGYFVLNDTGNFIAMASSQVLLTGGLSASDVLFNLTGGGTVSFNGNSAVAGLVLAPNSNISFGPTSGAIGYKNFGEIIGATPGHTITIDSGAILKGSGPSVPEVNSGALLTLGLLPLAAFTVRRRRSMSL